MNCGRCGERHECGTIVHTGQAKVAVQLSADELAALAYSSGDTALVQRLICALSLIDQAFADEVRREWTAAYLYSKGTEKL